MWSLILSLRYLILAELCGELSFFLSFPSSDDSLFDPFSPAGCVEPSESESEGAGADLLEEDPKDAPLLSDVFQGEEPLCSGSKVTLKDAICCLFVFYLVSHLSKTAFDNLLRLLHLIFPRNLLPRNIDEFLRLFRGSEGKTRIHEYSEECQVAFGENDKKCSHCGGWRYQGGEADQGKRRKRAFFIELPLEHDLRDLFKGGLLQLMTTFLSTFPLLLPFCPAVRC